MRWRIRCELGAPRTELTKVGSGVGLNYSLRMIFRFCACHVSFLPFSDFFTPPLSHHFFSLLLSCLVKGNFYNLISRSEESISGSNSLNNVTISISFWCQHFYFLLKKSLNRLKFRWVKFDQTLRFL